MIPEWYVYAPDGSQAIEAASGEWEAIQKARRRPNFAEGELRAVLKGTPAPPAMRSGSAAKWTRAFLEDHKDWKRED